MQQIFKDTPGLLGPVYSNADFIENVELLTSHGHFENNLGNDWSRFVRFREIRIRVNAELVYSLCKKRIIG